MKPARFTYEAPTTVAGALAALAARPEDAKVIAGGQSLAPMLNMRLAQPAHLIDINGLAELEGVRVQDDHLVVGALMRQAELARHALVVEHAPMLAHAAGTIGHYAIRQRGTLGGSLAHADPAAQLPLVALALDASMEIASARRRRMVPASEFFVSIFTTALQPDELLTAVHIPLSRQPEGWGFRLFARRAGDFALMLVACRLIETVGETDGQTGGRTACTRLVIGGIAAKPVCADDRLAPGPGDADWISRTANAVAADAEIEESERISSMFRRELLAACAQGALGDAMERLR
jgi:aerobic carbon-monoxide dehydrogenase medium subunit